MDTISVKLDVPADILAALNSSEEEFKKEITLSAAIWLYQQQRLSLAKAASLAGYERYDFENYLADNNIPIALLTIEDVMNDVKKM
jgi:predicted HTH domain antitoxin